MQGLDWKDNNYSDSAASFIGMENKNISRWESGWRAINLGNNIH